MATPSTTPNGRVRGHRRRATSNPGGDGVRAIGYLRVSTADQVENGSGLDAQRLAIEAACPAIDRWITDAGISAASMDRPGLVEARALLEAGEFDELVCSKIDRLTRSWADLGMLIRESQEGGWNLRILDPPLDLRSPFGRALAGMTGVFSELEREMVRSRTREAIAAAKAAGTYAGVKVTGSVCQTVRSLRSEGHTYREIADHLNDQGIPTTRRGAKWYASTVHGVLNGWEPRAAQDETTGGAGGWDETTPQNESARS